MDIAMLGLTIVTAMLAGASVWAAVVYGRRSARLAAKSVDEARASNELARERSLVAWRAGRQKPDNAGWFFVANVGEDTAQQVTLVASDGREQVRVEAERVPPYRPEQVQVEPHGYIEFRLTQRETNGPAQTHAPSLIKPPKASALRDEIESQERALIAREERQQVSVQITWRSELGRWSTETLRTG